MSEVTGRANMLPDAVLDGAVVDSSAIMGVFENRPSAMAFKEAFKRCRRLHMSAGTLAELSILFRSRKGKEGPTILDSYLADQRVAIEPFDNSDLAYFRMGCDLFGKGNGNRANLNYGDLFAFSLAKKLGLPILFEGLDFLETDLADAMQMLGYHFTKEHGPTSDRRG